MDLGARAPLQGVHVLLVEDDRDMRDVMALLLEQAGLRVTGVGSVDAAVAALEHDRPDVVVSDIGLPGRDGFYLIARIRALPDDRGGATPAIALTGYASAEDRARVLAAGYREHIPKPVDSPRLLAVIAELAAEPGS